MATNQSYWRCQTCDGEFERASIETARLQRELDITNADHIALWLEENMEDSTIGWLACRIIEAHEQEMALLRLKYEGPSDGR